MTIFVATIPGTPQQQGSKRFFNGRGIDANANLAPWRADAIHNLQRAMTEQGVAQFTGPVAIEANFAYARPKSHYGTGRNVFMVKPTAPLWKASAPDLDKLQRALGDALTQAGVLRDDALVVGWSTRKLWETTSSVRLEVRDAS